MPVQRKPLIAGNWKCFKTVAEGRQLVRELRNGAEGISDVDIVVAPPFTALAAVGAELSGSGIGLAAQNVHWEAQGAWTGEIAAEQLLDVGCGYAIIGHSERRQFFGETLRDGQSTAAALPGNQSHPHCVHRGNSEMTRESGQAKEVILGDLASLSGWIDSLTIYPV